MAITKKSPFGREVWQEAVTKKMMRKSKSTQARRWAGPRAPTQASLKFLIEGREWKAAFLEGKKNERKLSLNYEEGKGRKK